MIEERAECDVLVVGGGAAGIAAAVAAARTLRRGSVALLERYGFLGGMATAGMVGTVCGLYLSGPGARPRPVCRGFVEEWAERLALASSSRPVRIEPGLWVLPYDPWAFGRLADEAVRETRGLRTGLHAVLTGVRAPCGGAIEAQALVWNRRVVLRSRTLVDCTGEAVAAAMAGGALRRERGRQAPAVVFALDGVSSEVRSPKGRIALRKRIARACSEGLLAPESLGLSVLPSASKEGPVYFKLPLPRPARGGWEAMTRLETTARERIDEARRFLCKEAPGFRKARLSRVAAQVGIRTGLRAQGESTLNARDVVEGRKRDDGAARGAWPIEEWGRDARPRMAFPPEGDWYEIPAGCMIAKGLDSVFMAGRCVSAAEKALASCRVIGTALATGWAAGKMAAFRAMGRERGEAIEEIRRDLDRPTRE